MIKKKGDVLCGNKFWVNVNVSECVHVLFYSKVIYIIILSDVIWVSFTCIQLYGISATHMCEVRVQSECVNVFPWWVTW